MQMRNAPAFKPEDGARLATNRDLKLGVTVQSGHLYFSAKGSLSKVNRQLVENVVTISCEKLMLQY